MKKFLLVSSALVLASPALAADLPNSLPVKAPAVIPYSWGGCYVGGHVGAGWDHTTFTDFGNNVPGIFGGTFLHQTIAPLGQSVGVDGIANLLGGVQAGCDYQFASHWVVGIGGDFAWTGINGTANDPFFVGKNGNPVSLNTSTDHIASVTGRVGYAWDRVLLYGKGGAAWTHDNYTILNASCLFAVLCTTLSGNTDRTGWTAGVGLEWSFAPNWSAMVEYDHYGFGNRGVSFTDPNVAQNFIFNVKQDVDVVKVGINYRFGFSAPVVARY